MTKGCIGKARKVAALALVAALAGACGVHPAAPAAAASPSHGCSTSAANGRCGPYDGYRRIAGITSSTYIGNNVWHPVAGWAQSVYATDPGDWYVRADMPAGNSAVVSYPSVGANYGETSGAPTPLSDYTSLSSSFSEDMNATRGTSAWAAYDIWLGRGTSTSFDYEVMIQHDFASNGPCSAVATASFGGTGGVPVQRWNLCTFGTELVWKLAGGNEHSGTVDILAMLKWLAAHGYVPANAGLFLIGYGWEICSTGGHPERFQVSDFSVTATRAAG